MNQQVQNLFSTVVGHAETIGHLLTMVRLGRVPNCLLFVGPSGQGKKLVAYGLAQALVCERAQNAEACGVCPSCVRIARGQSESLLLLQPDKGQIKIEEARQIIQQLSLLTVGRARLVVIDEAQLLNPQAANALLKVIEEPPEKTHFVLISPSQEAVLSTLRSRSQIVRFRSLSREELSQLQRQTYDSEARVKALQFWPLLMGEENAPAIEFARENFSSREEGEQVLHLCFEFARDLWVHMKKPAAALLHPDVTAELNMPGVSEARLAALSEEILSGCRALQGNCDLQLTLENLINQVQEQRLP